LSANFSVSAVKAFGQLAQQKYTCAPLYSTLLSSRAALPDTGHVAVNFSSLSSAATTEIASNATAHSPRQTFFIDGTPV
jgi:hypothetical protein